MPCVACVVKRTRWASPFTALLLWLLIVAPSVQGLPTPPRTTITNTASASFSVGGERYSISDSETLITDEIAAPNLGRVFFSATGAPVSGAVITLLDASGQRANVFADNGVDRFPATVTSGGSVTDSGGGTYAFPEGAYRFPRVPPGEYRLRVVPPERFIFPSAAPERDLQLLDGAPFVLGPGARGNSFSVTASGVFVQDLPLDLAPVQRTPADIELFTLSPGHPAAVNREVDVTACLVGGGFVPSGDAVDREGGQLSLPQVVPLARTDRFVAGDAVYVTLIDADQDLDPFVAERVIVDVTVPGQTDRERIRLWETGPSTGVFSGFLQTGDGVAVANDCVLQAQPGSAFEFAYVDAADPSDAVVAVAMLDPGFTVFSSLTGASISGARVTLVEDGSGLPAEDAVFAADGVTPFPVTLTTGGIAVDAAGGEVRFSAGAVRWPVVRPGNYRLVVDPPVGLTYPSAVADIDLQDLPGAPFELTDGSRGASFVVLPGMAPGFDLPVDPVPVDVFVTKQASKEIAAVGDFVQYRVEVASPEGSPGLDALDVTDTLPKGFRYVAGSARVDGQVHSDPRIDRAGRGLTFSDLKLGPAGSLEVRYVTEVTIATELGRARNLATASGNGVGAANVAHADVMIREDLLTDKAIVVGRVVEGQCDAPRDAAGVAGVRIYLEDGSYVVTDEEGKYHFEGLDPGTHVVQLDVASLPASHEVARCDAASRFAGSGYSQFVDIQGGSLWRADFHVRPKPDIVTEFSGRLLAEVAGHRVHYRYELENGALDVRDLKTVIMLPEQLDYVGGSATVDGIGVADPSGAETRALQFVLPDRSDPARTRIAFDAKASRAGPAETKAITMFRSDAGPHRTPVATNTVHLQTPETSVTLGDARVHFAEARSQLLPQEQAKLTALIDRIAQRDATELFLHVIGHADSKPLSRASRLRFADNHTLSLARAQRVAAFMAERLNLPPDRIRVASHGAAEPLADNATHAGRARNRRVEVAVVGRLTEAVPDARHSDSGPARLEIRTSQAVDESAPYVIPLVDESKPPQFDRTWLAAAPLERAIAWPQSDFNPSIPSTWVAVTHEPYLQARLMVNGGLANPITFLGTVADRKRGLAVSVWENVGIREGDSELAVHLLDDTGKTAEVLQRTVHFGGRPIRAELVAERSYLVADGIHPPMLAVRLYDRQGYPARPGLAGEFSVDGGSFQAYNVTRDLDLLDNVTTQGVQRYQVREDGIAFVRLEPTTQTGEVALRFEFDEHRVQVVRARLRPGTRDWILVGVAEGVVGYNTLSGNMRSLEKAGLADEVLTQGRVAVYAKGQVKGKWLLTVAYDTDKELEAQLREQIDPNRFYTLYGDGAQQRFDAQSRRKLYFKLEGAQFAALFGDFDTGWDRTEFTRYARRMNGLQANYYSKRWELSGFASETELGYYRDEIRGDGTSGTYRLSARNVVPGSERIRLVTRDRFRTERIVEEIQLVRYIDYSIDYDAGSMIFKQPVFSQDGAFNPVFIEAEYEVADTSAGKDLVAGARVAYQLDDQDSEVALTYIEDGTAGREGELLGVDVHWEITPETEIKAELAQSRGAVGGGADAYLLEIAHQSEKLAGRAYLREQEGGFGLGQQAGIEQGSRKMGAEGEYQMSDQLRLRADVFEHTETSSGNRRLVVSSIGEYRLGSTRLAGGVRSIREEVGDGERRDAEQVTMGVGRNYLNNRLALRADAELDVSGGGENADYPSRAVVGAEYQLAPRFALIGEQEFGFGVRDTQDTRLGVKARPWQGADLNSTLQRERGENSERLFATTGLLQQLQLNERWRVDFGADRVQTLTRQGERVEPEQALFNPGLPPALGSFDDDFTAVFSGFGYRREQWDVSSRIEMHQGDKSDKWNYLLGASHQRSDGKVMSGSVALLTEKTAEGSLRQQGEARWGMAWRPAGAAMLYLNRLDVVFEKNRGDGFVTQSQKLVNNFNANYRPNPRQQLSLQLGFKYVAETVDGDRYDGFTGLLGMEYRHSLGPRWDWGVRGASLHSFASGVWKYSMGASVGRNVFDNAWASVGYNFVGFDDADFVGADYTAQGPYLKLRLKLDQDLAKRFLRFAGWREQPDSAALSSTD